jgi:hypothetical protein
MSKTIEHGWELELPAATPEQLLAALSARDRLFGRSVTLEPEDDPGKSVEVWLGTTDALEGTTYHLHIFAELAGPADYLDAAKDALEDVVGDQIEIAAAEAEEAKLIETRPAAGIHFTRVGEDDERPELVIPEWLAPDEEVELPWGFRPFEADGKAWPSDEVIKTHGRVAVVPTGEELRLYELPEIEDDEEEE